MIGRIWDVNAITGRYLIMDFVVYDSKGNMIHCTARGSIAHNFLRLKEGGIYSIKNFVVHPNMDEFWIIKHDTFMLEFDGATTIRKASVSVVGFLRYPFQLVDFDRSEPINNKHLIGRQSLRVMLWGGLCHVLIEKKTKHVGMFAIVLTSMSAKNYKNKLYLSGSSSTVIYDDENIPAWQELKTEISVIESNVDVLPADCSQPKEGTLENVLIWAQNHKNDV
ncbi:replication protein A 70 kDa DNA-binding subunit C-like protein [Tanacetum coccineum]